MSTVSDLVRHRVEAYYDDVVAVEPSSSEGWGGGAGVSTTSWLRRTISWVRDS